MRDTKPNDYTFEIIAYSLLALAFVGIGTIGYLLFSWIF